MKRLLVPAILLFSTVAHADPLTIHPGGMLMTVCGIEGYKPEPCLLDTGSRVTSVTGVDTQKYQVVGEEETAGIAGVSQKRSAVVLGKMRMEDIEANDVKVLIDNNESLHTIGSDFIHAATRGKGVVYNYEGMQIHTTDTKFQDVFPMDLAAEIPLLPVQVGDAQIQSLWDTGASITLVSEALLQSQPDNFVQTEFNIWITDSSRQNLKYPVYVMKRVTIGGEIFENSYVISQDMSLMNSRMKKNLDMIIGNNISLQANWYMNTHDRVWRLNRNSGRIHRHYLDVMFSPERFRLMEVEATQGEASAAHKFQYSSEKTTYTTVYGDIEIAKLEEWLTTINFKYAKIENIRWSYNPLDYVLKGLTGGALSRFVIHFTLNSENVNEGLKDAKCILELRELTKQAELKNCYTTGDDGYLNGDIVDFSVLGI